MFGAQSDKKEIILNQEHSIRKLNRTSTHAPKATKDIFMGMIFWTTGILIYFASSAKAVLCKWPCHSVVNCLLWLHGPQPHTNARTRAFAEDKARAPPDHRPHVNVLDVFVNLPDSHITPLYRNYQVLGIVILYARWFGQFLMKTSPSKIKSQFISGVFLTLIS